MRLFLVRLPVGDYGACFLFYRDVMGFPVTFGDERTGELNHPIPASE